MKHLVLLLVLPLSACEPQVDSDLREWAQGIRRQAPLKAPPVAAPASSPSFTYHVEGRRDPFDVDRLSKAIDAANGSDPLLAEDLRALGPLASYPLDSLRVVGSLRRAKESVALIEAERIVHMVRIGQAIGPARLVGITDAGIEIDERVQDAQGRWASRRTQLSLSAKGAR